MSRRSRLVLASGLLLVAAAIGFAAMWVYVLPRWRASQTQTQITSANGVSGSAVDIKNPTLRHTENGKLAWQLRLQQIALTRGGSTVGAVGVKEGLIYDANGKPVIRVTAKSAQGDTLSRDFQLDGDVRIVSERGALITSEQVRWSQADQRLICPGPVTVKTKDAVIAGSGVDYTVSDDVITTPNQVKMYAGKNRLVGQGLRYDVKSTNFTLQSVQIVLDSQEAKRKLKEARR